MVAYVDAPTGANAPSKLAETGDSLPVAPLAALALIAAAAAIVGARRLGKD